MGWVVLASDAAEPSRPTRTSVFAMPAETREPVRIDFAPVSLSESRLDLADYQHNHEKRFVSRIQLSMAVSKGESDDDRSTRFAPTLRIVKSFLN